MKKIQYFKDKQMRTLDDLENFNPSVLSRLDFDDKHTGAPKNIRQRQGAITGYFTTNIEIHDGNTHAVFKDRKATVLVDEYGLAFRLRNKRNRLFHKYSWFYVSFYDINLARENHDHLEIVDTANNVGFFFTKKKAVKFISSLVSGFDIHTITV